MKILITENQFKKLIENILIEQDNDFLKQFYKESDMKLWFHENIVSKAKEKTNPKDPDWIFYIDKDTGEEYMKYNKENGDLWIGYTIWLYFKSNYFYRNRELIQLIKDLMADAYGLKIKSIFSLYI